MNISTGSLDITSIRLNGSPISPEIKDGVFRAKGTLEIFFQGIFGNENGNETLENATVNANTRSKSHFTPHISSATNVATRQCLTSCGMLTRSSGVTAIFAGP